MIDPTTLAVIFAIAAVPMALAFTRERPLAQTPVELPELMQDREPLPETRPVKRIKPAPPPLTHEDYRPKTPAPEINLQELADSLRRNPLADVKKQFRELTYGEFIEAAEGLGCDPTKAWKWATA